VANKQAQERQNRFHSAFVEDPSLSDGVWTVLHLALAESDLDCEQFDALSAAINACDPPRRRYPGVFHAVAPKIRLAIQLSNTRGLHFTIAAALLADIATHNAPLSAAVAVVSAALDRVKILIDEERAVLDTMRVLSFGRIYRVWVNEADIIDALPNDRDTDAYRRTLANMKSKGILEEGAGKWRVIW
jgi:hypothetical protein